MVTIVSQHSNPLGGDSSQAPTVKAIPNSPTSRNRAILHYPISIQGVNRAILRIPISYTDKGKVPSQAPPCRGPMTDSLK